MPQKQIYFEQKTSFFQNSYQERAFNLQDNVYTEQKLIGSGSFSDVYLYKNEIDGSLHALKILKDNTTIESLLEECKIMKDLESQFVIKIENIIQIDDKKCIMMEYANQGTLKDFIQNIQNQAICINANQILDIACDIFLGLNTLHTKKIIHRDIKMDNLLVSNYQIKVADLGVATYLNSKQFAETKIGNILYAAREKLNDKYNSASDIFSAGLIIFQMIFGIKNSELLKLKHNNNYQIYFEDSPFIFKEFLQSLIDINPKSRLQAIDAYNQCRAFKYDQEVLNFINNNINRITKNIQEIKNSQISQQHFLSTIADTDIQAITTYVIEDEEYIFNKGMELFWNLNIPSAEQQFSKILIKNPLSVKGLCGRLLCGFMKSDQINIKQYSKEWIQEQLKLIKQLNPNYYMYYFCLGFINRDIYYVDTCLELNPQFTEAIAFKGALHIDQKEIDIGIQYVQQAYEMSQNSPFVLQMLGCVYLNISQDMSEQFFQKILQIDDRNYQALYYLGVLNNSKNKFDQALHYFDESLKYCPYQKRSIEQIILILLATQQYQTVIDIINKLFDELGEQDFLLFYLARSYHLKGNFTLSLQYYTRSLTYGENSVAQHNIGVIYINQQQYEQAKVHLQKCIDLQFKPSYICMFHLLKDQFNEEENAQWCLNQFLELYFDYENEEDCMYIILAHRLLEQYISALDYSDQFLKQHPCSKIICEEILNLISLEDFVYNLPQQNNIAELIQKSQGLSYQLTLFRLKYFSNNQMDGIVLSQIMIYLQDTIKKEQELNTDYRFPFEKYVKQDGIERIFSDMKQMCEDNPKNIHCQLYFLHLVFLNNITFSQSMIQGFEQVYNDNKDLFSQHLNQEQIEILTQQYLDQIENIKTKIGVSQVQVINQNFIY
ncbi:hypothetical protein ABPG72_017524 [Tetrahymena utriculariae]